VFGVIDDPLLVANDQGAIIMANAALGRQLGWGVFDTIGKPVTMLLAAADQPHLTRLLADGELVDQTRQIEARLMRRNGVTVPGQLQLTTIKQSDSQTFYVVKLLPKTNVVGADASFEQAVRNAMGQSAAGAAPVVAGKLQLVGLDAVRERLADRWPEMAERTFALAERVIQKYLQPGDIVRRSTDDGFLVFFGRLSESEAQFKARAIGDEIREKLIGDLPEMATAQVAAFATSVAISETEAESEETIVAALGRRLEEERKLREQSSMEQAKAALRTAKAAFLQVQTEHMQAAPILVTLAPKALRDSVETLRSLGQTPFSLETEVFLLAGAGERILADLGKPASDLIVVPVRVATLSQPRDLEAWLNVARTLGDAGRRQVVAEVIEVPRDIAQARMRDIAMRLASLFRTVAFELPVGDSRFISGLPDASRLVTIEEKRLEQGGAARAPQMAARLVRQLAPRNCRLIVKGARSSLVPALAKSGVSLFLPRHD
jgi:PAS domain S-box-containing protein